MRWSKCSNISIHRGMPYVGQNALHKGGMHVDGVVNSTTFEHVAPEQVGNSRKILASEVAGRSAILEKVGAFYPEIQRESPEAARIIDMVKQMEHQGYQFEGAESSFELEVRNLLGTRPKFLEPVNAQRRGRAAERPKGQARLRNHQSACWRPARLRRQRAQAR